MNAAGTNGITQTIPVNFTTPDVVGITLDAAPTQTTTAPGGTVNATLTVKSVGNVAAANIPLTLRTSTGLSVSGLPATVSLGLGETKTFPLTLTAHGGALNNTLTATITATFGRDLDGNPYTSTAMVGVSVRSAETLPIERAAQTSASVQNTQLAQNLASLAEVTAQLQQKPGDAPLCGRATLLYDQLLQLADVNSGLTAMKPQIQALRDLAAACNTSQLLTDSAEFFTNNFNVQVASLTPAVSLLPASVTLEPGQGTTFNLRLENKDGQSATFNLSVDSLPAGVTAQLNRTSVTLGAGEVLDASSANPVTLTLSQTLTSVQTFPVRVLATLAGASVNLAASGLVRIAPSQADVVSVTADPVVIDQTQTTTTVTARILNAANITRSALARLQVLDQTGTVLQTLPSVAVNLAPSTEAISVNLGTVSITGLNNGIYQLQASLLTTANQPLPGRSAETLLFVGMPITATVRAEPTLVAPGNPTVKTIIEVASWTPASLQCSNLPTGSLGPTPYLEFADSPFFGLTFPSYFYFEDFEDHQLNTPGVSTDSGGPVSIVFGSALHDSVDADDGIIDGSGLAGDDYFSGNGSVSFSFNATSLGGLPTHVGIVWTDGNFGTTLFEVFDKNNVTTYPATEIS